MLLSLGICTVISLRTLKHVSDMNSAAVKRREEEKHELFLEEEDC